MAQHTERTVLNHLIETCTDAERGVRRAAGLVSDAELKALFLETAEQRARFASELLSHAQRLGGPAASDGTTGASLHRRWMDIKSAFSHHDDHAIIAETARGDAVSLVVFKEAVEGVLPPTVRDLVERQYADVRAAHERIAALDRVLQHPV